MFDEPDILLLERRFNLAYPCLVNGQMAFKKAFFNELVERNDFGVKLMVPSEKSSLIVPDVLIIPGVAFNKEGLRLGRGRGFYDRYLEKFTGVKIGVAFSEQLRKGIPCKEHDVAMDYVALDTKCFFKGKSLEI